MCGRYAITTPLEAMERLFNFEGQLINMPARYNVAPTQDVPIVRIENNVRKLAMVRWGLVPHWAKEIPTSKPLINARSETISEKASFRTAYRRQRCILIADGFYEWKRTEDQRLPFYAYPSDGGMFAMAGVWDVWKAPTGEELQSVAIVTTEAKGQVSQIHHRMPVVIRQQDIDTWLAPAPEDMTSVDRLLSASPADFFALRPISNAVNKVANDGPEILDEVDHSEMVSPAPATKKPDDQMSLF